MIIMMYFGKGAIKYKEVFYFGRGVDCDRKDVGRSPLSHGALMLGLGTLAA